MSQPHQQVPSLPKTQASSGVMGSLAGMGCWSLQDYEPWCLAQKLIPNKCSFTQLSPLGSAGRRTYSSRVGGRRGLPAQKKKKKIPPCLSFPFRDYVRSALPQLWGMEIVLGGAEWTLKAMVRGFLLSDELQGSLRFRDAVSFTPLSHS